MSPVALSALLALAAVSRVRAQTDGTPTATTPLVDKTYAWGQQPYQVDPLDLTRGPQQGYNICNSTTQNQESMCQTMVVNHIDDFCLWAPPIPNSTIGDTEGEEVAWCTKPGYGTRLMPAGALQGMQYLIAPDYIMLTGFVDQSLIDMAPDDFGGELDPHGADLRGNPIGGLLYSNAYPTTNTDNSSYTQVNEWTEYIGSNTFCIKICNPQSTNQLAMCNNRYDLIGISFNCPSTPTNGTFEVCDSDDMDPVGVYTSDGQTITWSQPNVGPVTSVPYTPTPPASSNCRTYASTDLFTALPTPTGASASASSGGASATSAPSGNRSSSNGSSASRSGSAGSASATGAGANGAGALKVSAAASIFGTLFAVLFLA
ncbi:hypothetical protein CERSUDRAFT_89048 [Gelatoporia subvermispora B]|uniref:Macrofage activating glycoprotein n=1 Tax=Ceriporiopsis subvermispora (strain B) TaxID=914234 RepID=M2QYC4_CERS8|nr:hypothetical protein CERSUDRAFT_89048 [Gelatoporia subvermispora B]